MKYYSLRTVSKMLGVTSQTLRNWDRFGFELVEYFAKLNNVKIEVLSKKDKSKEEELVEDLVQIVTVFSCKLQGKRSKKTKEMVDSFLKEIEQ